MSTPPVEQTNFVYKLGGNPSEIDVFALAPTLLALGQLIQEANRTIHPEGKQIAVNVKPFKEGSFLVDVVLFPTEALYPILALTKDIPPDQIMGVLTLLGIVKTTKKVADAASSVLDVIRKLGGKPTKIEPLKSGDVRLSAGDKSVTVNGDLGKLVQNNNVTNNFYGAYGKPLEDTKFQDVESYLEGQDEERKTIVTREDLPALKKFAGSDPVTEEIRERILEGVLLNPKRGAFEGDGSQWSFHRGDQVITATIRDPKFLRSVELGEIRPNHSDLMTVILKETQRIAGTKVHTPRYEILEVTDYEVGAKQMRMDLSGFANQKELSEGKDTKALPPAPEESGGE